MVLLKIALISALLNFRVLSIQIEEINIAFFLEHDDYASQLLIKHTVNAINERYTAHNLFLNPLIYSLSRKHLGNVQETACALLEDAVAAIFNSGHREMDNIIQSISLTFQIPQIQTYWNPNLESFTKLSLKEPKADPSAVFNFNLHPSATWFSKALWTLIRDSDWKSYTIIYESNDGLFRLQELMKAGRDYPVTYRKLGPGPDHRIILKEIVLSGAVHIVLDCHPDNILNILSQAKEVGLNYQTYILTSLDAGTINWRSLGEVNANISFFTFLNQNIMDQWQLDDQESRQFINTKSLRLNTALLYDALNYFVDCFKKRKFTVKKGNCANGDIASHGKELASVMLENNITNGILSDLISGPISFNRYGERLSFKLQVIELNRLQFRYTNIWDSNHPDDLSSTLTSEDREREKYQQLQGKNVRVVSRLGAPYLMQRFPKEDEVLKGNDAFEGYAMDLIDGICRILNCTYSFELVPDNNYGKYDPDTKQWNGLIRHLLDRKADLAICDLTTTYERRKAVDFTTPFMTLGISILYAKAVKEPPDLLAFTKPLSLDIWLYMATAYMVISIIIFMVARLSAADWENPHPCNETPEELENVWNVKNCFWLTLGSIMAQGCDILPKGISTRMVAGMWWFFSLILTACYTANLAAFLTQERMGPTITSADDLGAQSKIKYGCVRDGATASFFKDSNVTTYHKMWVQMEASDPSAFEITNDDGVNRVITSNGKYAFFMESSAIEYEMERHCELVQVGTRLDTKGYGIAMPTNAPYRTTINQAILKMQEMGKLHQLKERWWKEKNQGMPCTKDKTMSEDMSSAELGLPHVGGVFVVLAGGMSVALLIAVCEFLWSVRKVAVKQRMSLQEAFWKELRFAMDIWVRQKIVETDNRNGIEEHCAEGNGKKESKEKQ